MSASANEGQGEARQNRLVIPFAAPIADDGGRLTHLVRDGLPYVVAD